MAQKEMVLLPTVVHHHSHHHVEQEVIVDDHAPQEGRIIQQTIEEVVEVPVPMAQEEIMHVPMVVNHHRHHHVEQANLFRLTDICFETSSSEACGTMT